MMTKAGVPSHKIVVGVTSYGRSFKMADATCRGPLCTYLGERNDSPAKPGRCTETGGYISNYEINEIIKQGGAIKSWYDEETDSDYLVYNSVEWVAYMTDKTKDRRRDQYKGLNCGGTTDWAIDLQGEGRRAETGDPVYLDPILPSPTTIDPGKYTTSLLYGSTAKTTSNDEVITAFVTQTTTITLDLPVITTDEVSYSNVNITRSQDASELWVGVSIPIGPVTGPPIRGDGDDDNDDDDWELPNLFPTTAAPEPTTNEPAPTTLPTWRTYPPYVVEPVNEEDGDDDDDDDDDDGAIITSCKLWFFNICLGGRFKSIRWTLPPGIYPPGPPPPDILGPPGNSVWSIQPPLPPWPPLTVGRDNKLTYSNEPSCQTESAELCSTTVSKSETLVGTITSTVTATSSACETVYGCSLTDSGSTKTTTASVCEPTSGSGGEYQPPAAGCPAPAIVYPKDPENVGSIPSLLQGYKDYVEVGLTTERWVAFYWIPMLGQDTMDALRHPTSNTHTTTRRQIYCPAAPGSASPMRDCGGTSFASPQVAALANYFRSVPSPWQSQLDKPSNVKKLIQLFARRFVVHDSPVLAPARRLVIWNGQVGEHSCLREYGSTEDWAKVCPTIKDNLENEAPNPGEDVKPCFPNQNTNPPTARRQLGRRQSGGGSDSCPLIPGDNSGPGQNINWNEGPSGPKCTSENNCGGELCKGYYCDPHPEISHPPDYYDPKDPQNPHGMPPQKPTSTSTTTGTSPTTTSSPPVETLPLCLGTSTTPSSQFPIYAYSIYAPGSHRNGIFASNANIGSSPPICDISKDEFSFDFCKKRRCQICE
ncbi:hypothetical protein N7516_003758 [Penicillium verrucosum]|uniref:uncharacterized protein n=1 Tax=Penicillium verrucosum TaxID=60171 RepID=UPI002545B792|nr:uncharacterized protein N7516_003758 [Penicillium verrucosum]KAJ5943590.1 hypothetical protein N7516_003758 [Penicillium verrucosum]